MHRLVAPDEKSVPHERKEQLARKLERKNLEHSELQACRCSRREPKARDRLTRCDVRAARIEPACIEPDASGKPERLPGSNVSRTALDAADVERKFAGSLGAADLALKSGRRKPERI